ncbi:hypothetical protein DUQ00_14035 [Salmonella bongori]|nr:hypothetical protein [Salmonella bongori]ECC9597418.1 hypothetical protein [Salmonella bongori]ECG1194011.1 hypothetical protein [Salmonella bongori]
MSVPVYQIMVKGCHIQEENLSFSPHLQKSFVVLQERSQKNLWITLCINYCHCFKISAIVLVYL